MIKIKNKILLLMISLILVVIVGLFLIGNNTKAAQGTDPKTTISLEKDIVGSGLDKPSGVFVTQTNGYNPGYTGQDGSVLASGDQITYTLKIEVLPSKERRIAYRLNVPEYLEFNQLKNINICTSNMFLKNAKFDKETLTCSYEVVKGAATSFETTVYFTGKDTKGSVISNQVLSADIGVGIDANNPVFKPYETVNAKAISVISAPMADLMIKPSQCNMNGSCSQTIHTSISGSFELLVNPLRHSGYNNAFGSSAMTPWTAQIDVSDFPGGTIWTLSDGTVLDVANGIINIPETVGNSKVNFKVPDANWGSDEFNEGEVRSYDVHLIVPDTAFATTDYQNNGNGWEPGQNEGKDYYSQKEKEVGARQGWYYANNDWTRYVVYKPIPVPPPEPTSTIAVGKTLKRPWNNNQTLWEDGNMIIGEGSLVNGFPGSCSTSIMCTTQVSQGTEFIASFSLNVLSLERAKLPMTLSDTWNGDQVEVLGLESIDGPLNVAKVEWLVNDNWQTSSTAITGATAFKISYDGENALGVNTVNLKFKVKDSVNSGDGLNDTAKATYINKEDNPASDSRSASLVVASKPEKKLSLGVSAKALNSENPDLLDNRNREASWTYTPQVSGLTNSKQVIDAVFTIDLDPGLTSFELLSDQYEIVSLELGNVKTGAHGTVVLKPKGGSYLGTMNGGVVKMPPINFTGEVSMLAVGNITTSMSFTALSAEDFPNATAQKGINAERPKEFGAILSTSTPKAERNQALKYQYILMGNVVDEGTARPQAESVIILPTNKDNSDYVAAVQGSGYDGPETSKFSNPAAEYIATATKNEINSTDASKLMCTTDANPNMDPSVNDWKELGECNNSKDVTAYKVVIEHGINEGVITVDFNLQPMNNSVGDNYLMWASHIYSENDKGEAVRTSIVFPENDVIVGSSVKGYTYWDVVESGTPWNKEKEGISSTIKDSEYPNLKVQLQDTNGNPIKNEYGEIFESGTDEDGMYEFEGLISGQYQVELFNAPTNKTSAFYKDKKLDVKPSYVYNNVRGENAQEAHDTSTVFRVAKEQAFGIVGFGFYGPDPYTNIMKKPADIQCTGDNLECDIQWNILIKSGNLEMIPGKIKLMHVQGEFNTIVVTDKNQIYAWGTQLSGLNVRDANNAIVTTTAIPLQIPTEDNINAAGDNIVQVAGSHQSGSERATLMFLTQGTGGQKLYIIGNGTVDVAGGSKFGMGTQLVFPELTNIATDGSQLADIIKENDEIKSIQGDGYVSTLLMNNGKVFITGRNDSGRTTNMTGATRNTWTPIKIVKGNNQEDITDNVFITKIVTSNWAGMGHSTTAIDDQNNLYTAGAAKINGFDVYKSFLTLNTNVGMDTKIVDFRNYYDSNIAISDAGNVYVWGNNKNGMLGNGQTSGQQNPILNLNHEDEEENITALIDFEAAEILTSNNNMRNSCNILKGTDKKVYAAGQCRIPGTNNNNFNSSKFKEVNYDNSDYSDTVIQQNSSMVFMGMEQLDGGSLTVFGNAGSGYYPSGLPLAGDANSSTGAKVDGPWIENELETKGQAGSIDINDLVLTDNTSSQVYDISANLFSMKTDELIPNVNDLGFISPSSVNTLMQDNKDTGFTSRIYNLPMLERGIMYQLRLSGKINKTKNDQVIGNQAWLTSKEIDRIEEHISFNDGIPKINPLPKFDKDIMSGKWEGNTASACGVNTDWAIDTSKQDNCDQVFAGLAGTDIPLGELGGIVFKDEDGQGIYKPGYKLLENVKVYLLKNEEVIASQYTDKNGSYLFENLLPNDTDDSIQYTVTVQLPTELPDSNKSNVGWKFTKQANATCTVSDQSCVDSSGETNNLIVKASKKTKADDSVGTDTVNAGLETVESALLVEKGYEDNGTVNSTLNAEFGKDYTVSVKVTNTGNDDLSNFIFEDQTFKGSEVTWSSCVIGGRTVTFPEDNPSVDNNYYYAFPTPTKKLEDGTEVADPYILAVGDTMTCTGNLTGLKSIEDNHQDTVSITAFGNDTGAQVSGPAQFNANLDIPQASITLTKGIIINNNLVEDKTLVDINTNNTIEFKIANDGKQDIINPKLNDTTNDGVDVSDIRCNFDIENINGNVVDILKVGTEATCSGTLNIADYSANHKNTAQVTGEGLLDNDTVLSNEASFEAYTLTLVESVNEPALENHGCSKLPTIKTEEIEGIEWSVIHDADKQEYTVTATAKDGYIIKDGIQSSWTITYKFDVCPITAPVLSEVECGEIPTVITKNVEGMDWVVSHDESKQEYTVVAQPKDGYEFEENTQTIWTLSYTIGICPLIAPDISDVECNEIPEVITKDQPGMDWVVSHDEAKQEYTVVAQPKDGYEFEENAQTSWTLSYTIGICPLTAPDLSEVECDEIPEVITKDQPGMDWIVSHDEAKQEYTVVAQPKDGYEFEENAQTSWTLSYTIEICPIIDIPVLSEVECDEIPEVITKDQPGMDWIVSHDKVKQEYTVIAQAKEGYIFGKDVQTILILKYKVEKCQVTTTTPLPPTGSNSIIYLITSVAISLASGLLFVRKDRKE